MTRSSAQVGTFRLIGLAAVAVGLAIYGCAFAIQVPTASERKLASDESKICADPTTLATVCSGQDGGARSELCADGGYQANKDDFCDGRDLALHDEGDYWVHPAFANAEAFCTNIQLHGNKAWKQLSIGGWALSTVAAGAVGGLTAAAAKSSGTLSPALYSGGAAASMTALALGVYLINQAGNGRRAAAAAGEASFETSGKSDDEQFRGCVSAVKVWAGANADSEAAAIKQVADALIKNSEGGKGGQGGHGAGGKGGSSAAGGHSG